MLIFFVLSGLATDLPGYEYGMLWFAAATTVILVLRLIVNNARRVEPTG